MNQEEIRLQENYDGKKKWLEWGPYLSERQWGTVREDYSADGDVWGYFPHDQARSRVYRWGEDGIAGICDRHCAIAFAVAMWNGKDPILKERLYGLNGPEGNHGEDCKELYYYLDSTPTHSYMKHLYKYPQRAFPYEKLVNENSLRGKFQTEYELLDTGIFDEDEYFDVFTEYAKADDEDILVRITVYNRAENDSEIWLLPTLWLRNLWSFGVAEGEHIIQKEDETNSYGAVKLTHPKLEDYYLYFEKPDKWLFTRNETNHEKLFGSKNKSPYVKDLFHDVLTSQDYHLTDQVSQGTKFSPLHHLKVGAGQNATVKLRFSKKKLGTDPLKSSFDKIFNLRIDEADEFYSQFIIGDDDDLAKIQRQAFAGMMWSKQYFNIDMEAWKKGDPGHPPPPLERLFGRNWEWMTLNNEDIISMPDKWEYPWYAAWDLGFHCIPIAMLDAEFAKEQMILMTREWYMAPNGQIPAYEWAFSDVNPPVQAWASFQIYEIDKKKTGKGDIKFLKRMLNKLALNFTWWVNQKDHNGNNVFEGGFLGLDNIGVLDRSSPIPGGGFLEQSDGTAWMALYCLNMLQMSIEVALHDDAYEDMATKYLEHFVFIAASLNKMNEDWPGCWDEKDGFFYDLIVKPNKKFIPIKVRSLVGLMTLNAVLVLEREKLRSLPHFYKSLKWFRDYRNKHGQYRVIDNPEGDGDILLTLVPKQRIRRLINALLDKAEFFSPYGIRSLSKKHKKPYQVMINGEEFSVKYDPGESSTELFGGNSNWRGPIWMPMNFLFVEALKEYHKYFGDDFKVAHPDSSREITLSELSDLINQNLVKIFQLDENGDRPVNRLHATYYRKEHFNNLILFYEYFHGDNGRGVGAAHQTGWTGLVAHLINESCWHEKHKR